MKHSHSTMTLLVYALSPLLSIPTIVTSLYRRERGSVLFVALLFGIIAYLTIPIGDLYRHNMTYFYYVDLPYHKLNVDDDWLIPVVCWFMANHTIPYDYLRYFELTEVVFLLLSIFYHMIDVSPQQYTKREVFLRLIIFLLFFEVLQTISGVRFGFAVCQFVFGYYLFFYRKKRVLGVIFFLLSTWIHFSMTFLVPLSLIISFLCFSKKASIVLLCFSVPLLTFLLIKFHYLLEIRADWYFSGGSSISGNGFSGITTNGFLLFYVPRLAIIPFAYFLFKRYDFSSPWNRLSMAWLILIIAFISNAVFLFRACFIFQILGMLHIIDFERKKKLSENMIKLLILCGTFLTVGNMVNYKSFVSNSRYERLALPLPAIFLDHYDYAYIISHINSDGNVK